MKIVHPTPYLIVCLSLLPSHLFAGSVNGAKSSYPGTSDRPNCDYRRVTLDRCDSHVQKYLRDNCYVVVHDKNSPQSSVCTWQSCAGLSLVGEKPKYRVIQQHPKIFEFDEYGIKTKVNAPSLPTDWKCDYRFFKCLPKADPFSGSVSVQKDFNGNFESASHFPRTYLTLGEALDLKETNNPNSSPALENARTLLRRPELDSVMLANPYYACAAGTKIRFLVERRHTNSSASSNWLLSSGLDGRGEYTVEAASWKDACRKYRRPDTFGLEYRCRTEKGELLREPTVPRIWMESWERSRISFSKDAYSYVWKRSQISFTSTNWRAECPTKIQELKKGNNDKWRCWNEITRQTQE